MDNNGSSLRLITSPQNTVISRLVNIGRNYTDYFRRRKVLLFLIFNSLVSHLLIGQTYSVSDMNEECKLENYSFKINEVKCPIYIIKNEVDTIHTLYPKANGPGSDFNQFSEIVGISNLGEYTNLVQVSFFYTGCCSTIYDYYVLVKENNETTELNTLIGSVCDGYPKFAYIFPGDRFGQDNVILKAMRYYKNDTLDHIIPVSRINIRHKHIEEYFIENW